MRESIPTIVEDGHLLMGLARLRVNYNLLTILFSWLACAKATAGRGKNLGYKHLTYTWVFFLGKKCG